MLRKSKSSKKNRYWLLAGLFLLVVGGIFATTYARDWWRDSHKPAKPDSTDVVKTRPATSEGKKFDVPADLPKDAVKDYILVTENERFKIRREGGTDSYIITLYAIINRPDQYSMYQDQLREYKQAALNYLKDTGVNLNKANISYEPQEATNL